MPLYHHINGRGSPYRQLSPINQRKLNFANHNESFGSCEEPELEQIPISMTEEEIRDRRALEWVCGRNVNGELSLGVKKNALVPTYCIGLKDVSTKMVCSSSNHTILLASNGTCFLAGSKLHGKLGKNADTSKLTIFKEMPLQRTVKQVACNDYQTLCLLQDSTLIQMAGSHNFEPKPLPSLMGLTITDIQCGEHHSCALDTNGDLYTWGGQTPQYNKGQLGHGDHKP